MQESKEIINTEQEILQTISYIPFENFLKEANPDSIRRETFLVPVEHIILAKNIRPFDMDFIEVLAESIKENGQLQECIGDIVLGDDGEFMVRVIAGQHRTMAIKKINMDGEYMPVRVNVADRTLAPEKIVEIQMSENLQNKMTAAQDAGIIHDFWIELKRIRESEGRKITKQELARKIGRSPDTVRNAIKYIEDINPFIQKLVDEKSLPYSLALLLNSVDKGDGYNSKQLNLALLFIAKSYTLSQAEKHMKRLKAEEGFIGPLFGEEEWEVMEVKNHMIAIREQADREGKLAAGWFVKMIRIARILGEPQKVKISRAIKRSVKELGISLGDFKNLMKTLTNEEEWIDFLGGEDF